MSAGGFGLKGKCFRMISFWMHTHGEPPVSKQDTQSTYVYAVGTKDLRKKLTCVLRNILWGGLFLDFSFLIGVGGGEA